MSYKRLIELEKLLTLYDHAYFQLDIPLISDEVYDILYAEWKKLTTLFPEHESALNVGFVQSEKTDDIILVPITEPMLSIAKFNDAAKILSSMSRYNETVIEEKLDGVGVRINYTEGGELDDIHLRGDGFSGQSILSHISEINGIPRLLNFNTKVKLSITGEIVCLEDDFKHYCLKKGLINKSARNRVAGILRRTNERDDIILPLYFIAFHASKPLRDEVKTYDQLVNWFNDNGFITPCRFKQFPQTKPTSIHPIDGVVIKANDLSRWDNQPFTGYYSYAGCFKYPTKIGTTQVTGVTWGVNGQGKLIGVLNFNPIILDGAILTRCQFHYPSTYIKNGIRIGSEIEVTRSNEVIPKLLGMNNVGTGKMIVFPTHCPTCDNPLIQQEENYHCNNKDCPGKITLKLVRAVSDVGLDIKGLGIKKITQLVNNNTITSLHQLFTLTKKELASIGVKGKTADNVISEINKTKNNPSLVKWLYSLSIPHLGLSRSIDIEKIITQSEEPVSVSGILETLNSLSTLIDLFGVDGIKIATYVSTNYHDLEMFLNYGCWENYRKEEECQFLVAITGKLEGKRDELKNLLKLKNYHLDNIITKSTHCLLVGDKPSPGKIALTKRYGIPIIEVEGIPIKNIVTLLDEK